MYKTEYIEMSLRQIMTLEPVSSRRREKKTTGIQYELGRIIQRLRTEKQLSQTQLAKISNLSFSVVNQIESGHSGGRLETLKSIFDALSYPLWEALREIESPSRHSQPLSANEVVIEPSPQNAQPSLPIREISIETESQQVRSSLSINKIDFAFQPPILSPTNGTKDNIQIMSEPNVDSNQLSNNKLTIKSQYNQLPLSIRELKYFVHVEYGKLSAKCHLALCYRRSHVSRKLELPEYKPVIRFTESQFFVSLLKTTLDDLKQVINKSLVNGEVLNCKFQPILGLTRKHPAIKSELGRIEGIGWAVLIRDDLKIVERINDNQLLVANTDAIEFAREAGYIIDDEGVFLAEPKQ